MLGDKKQAANLIATRTHVIDRTIEQLMRSHQIDTVVNLGAGLDTRPYRLSLPRSLQWDELGLLCSNGCDGKIRNIYLDRYFH